MFTIDLPWPPRELSPNARVVWQVRAAAVAAYRDACWKAAVDARNRGAMPYMATDPMTATFTFVPATNHHRDLDNLLAAVKGGIDGIVDAKILKGDDTRYIDRIVVQIAPASKSARVQVVLSGAVP